MGVPEAKTNPQGSGGRKMSEDNKTLERNENVANDAASVNNSNETSMKISTVEALQAECKQIVFLAFNRDVTNKTPHVKRLAKSIKEEGLHTPLHLVPATTAISEGIEVLDDKGSTITDGTDKYVLVDGNNKYRAIQVLRASKEPGKAVAPIKCIIDEDAKEIQKMVMSMNNVVKAWSNADSIKAASKTKPNEVVNYIAEKVKEGFSFSTISLALTGQNNKIKKDVIMKYIAGTGELPKCNVEKAKKKLAAMKEAGFSDKFIKSRYLFEAIDDLVKDEHKLDDVLAALKAAGLTVTSVRQKEDWRCVTAKK